MKQVLSYSLLGIVIGLLLYVLYRKEETPEKVSRANQIEKEIDICQAVIEETAVYTEFCNKEIINSKTIKTFGKTPEEMTSIQLRIKHFEEMYNYALKRQTLNVEKKARLEKELREIRN